MRECVYARVCACARASCASALCLFVFIYLCADVCIGAGIQQGSHVGILAENCVEWVLADQVFVRLFRAIVFALAVILVLL